MYIKDATKYEGTDKVTVQVCMENATKEIKALSFKVYYPEDKLEYIKSKAGDDLNAAINMSEKQEGKACISTGAASIGGFKDNGTYYEFTFKVLDDSEDINLKLEVTESSNSEGNDLKVDTTDGKITISKEKKNIEKSSEDTVVTPFEETKIEENRTIDSLIEEKSNITFKEDDDLVYEVDSSDVLELSDNGMIIPKKDGTANVRVKLNGNDIGNIEVNVKDGKVESVAGSNDVKEFTPEFTTKSTDENYNKENEATQKSDDVKLETNISADGEEDKVESTSSNSINKARLVFYVVMAIFVILVLFLLFKFIRSLKN